MKNQKKVALITGASRGIGAAIARAFGAAGYHLVLCCKNHSDRLNELAKAIHREYEVEVRCHQGDVSDAAFVRKMVEESIEEFAQIDVLINNAGISMVGLLQDLSDEDWEKILSVNLSSVFYACKAVIPSMVRRQSGSIINISSVWGNVGASCEVAYSATKGGINSFTKALAKELAPSNIAVNALACGTIDTEMNGHLDEDERAELANEIPIGRFGTPEEVAECALHLAQMPTYLTGQIITVDGGWI
ncbi:MAG: SDR family NAD(P)-dependent oxidoreductase [Lachnospiraceae bacterium]|nr:SDR family NAD(P)-dependent oxidoreductase [Lachnospiraceae bacterium]